MAPAEQNHPISRRGTDEDVLSPLSPSPPPKSVVSPQPRGVTPTAPDGGWGWVVVACSFYVAVIALGVVLSFGILFSETLTRMGVSSTTVAWILNVHCFLWNLSTMLVGPLCAHFGWRAVGAVGSMLTAMGFMLLTFATTPLHIFLLFSILIGTIGGAASNVCFLVVSRYFNKRRGLATGIVTTGVAVGQIVVPLLLRGLQDEYGFKGASLVFGAVVLNCSVASLSFHPVERHAHQSDSRRRLKTSDHLQFCDMEKPNDDEHVGMLLNKPNSEKSNDPYHKENIIGVKISNSVVMKILKTTAGHLKEMRHLRVVMVTLSFAFLLVGYVNFIAQVPFAMQAEGHTPQDSSRCVSVSAIGGTLTRMLVCCFSDRNWFSRKVCYVAGSVLAAVSTIGVVLALSEVHWIMVYLVFWGVGIGASFSTFHALMIDTCGLNLYESCVSVTGLLLAVLSLVIGPFVGLIRDLSSYSWSMSTCAMLQLSCALLWGLEPWAKSCDVTKCNSQSRRDGDNEAAVKNGDGIALHS